MPFWHIYIDIATIIVFLISYKLGLIEYTDQVERKNPIAFGQDQKQYVYIILSINMST